MLTPFRCHTFDAFEVEIDARPFALGKDDAVKQQNAQSLKARAKKSEKERMFDIKQGKKTRYCKIKILVH